MENTLTDLQNKLASENPQYVVDAKIVLRQQCDDLFPAYMTMSPEELFEEHKKVTCARSESVTNHWLRVWYLRLLIDERQGIGSSPIATTAVGALLIFLANEVDLWTNIEGRCSAEVIDALTSIVAELKAEEDGRAMNLKKVEQAAILICVNLELLTGDDMILTRFGSALKAVMRSQDLVGVSASGGQMTNL
jgi:hypothetical protein